MFRMDKKWSPETIFKNGVNPKNHMSRINNLLLKKMKKPILKFVAVLGISLMLTSCYTYTFSVGEGAQTGMEVKKMNHYLIYGLAPVNVSDPNVLAGDAEDYNVTITHTFVDGLINAITLGIYSPTTTIITK